jgi:glycosyltransferase involved in cell wall biosynthesis
MRIGIDARVIRKYPGLGRVCYNLIKEIAIIDKRNEYIIFGKHPSLNFLEGHRNFRYTDIDFPVLSARTLFLLQRIIKREGVELFYSPFQVTTIFPPCPMVITVHDMMDLFYPDAFSHHPFYINYALRTYFRFVIPKSIRNATMITSVSESTKRDILKYFHVPEDKVEVIHNGVEEKFSPVKDEHLLTMVKEKYNLPDRFVLYLGSTKPYKNLDGTLEAFSKLKKKNINSNNHIYLVIGGLRHFSSSDLEKKLRELGIENDFLNIGYISEEDLPSVYSRAEVFLFPSIWEGFGLPALEAMACGTPVVTSNTSSLPEVVGEAGIMVDPKDTTSIAEALYRILNNRAIRKELSGKGIKEAKKFSWRMAAEKLLKVFSAVARN